MEISTISDWIMDNHPELVIDEEQWRQKTAWEPGAAWYHMYSEKHGRDYVLRYDDYETIKGAYQEYVSAANYENERQRKRLY